MIKKVIFGAATMMALGFAGAPAMAQSDGSWTGGYVGGHIGYGFQSKDDDETILFDRNLDGTFGDTVTTTLGANAFSPGFCGGSAQTNAPGGGCDGDDDGVDFGIHAGYDIQMGSIVFGLVAEYGRSDLTDSVSAFSTTPASYTITRRLRDNAALRARAGVALGDTLIFGTGGVAWGKVRNRFATTNVVNTFVDNGNDDAWGYRFGGGVEHKFGPSFTLGIQYLYTSLKDDDFRVRAQGPAPAANPFILGNPAGTDFARSGDWFNSQSVQLTASYRF